MALTKIEESLTVENFGGIASAEIPIAKINVLIGPQASGKSLVAKLIYFCKSFPKEMLFGAFKGLNRQDFQASISARFVEFFGAAIPKSDFSIRFKMGDDFVWVKSREVSKSRRKVEVKCSDYFLQEGKLLRQFAASKQITEGGDEFSAAARAQHAFWGRLHRRFEGVWKGSQIFVPAGRSFFGILQGKVFSLLTSNVFIDPFIREFGSVYEKYKAFESLSQWVRLSTAEQLIFDRESDCIEKVLKGRYFKKGGEDYIESADGREVPINSSSSGQQEALPLLLMIKYILRKNSTVGRTVYVEEPEAHLFPESQQHLVELLAYALAGNRVNSQLVITTHSPYVCATLNNLILAGDVLKKNPSFAARVRKITTMGAFVDFENFSALSMENGNVRSVLDREFRLIDSTYLDNISESLIAQREKLLDVLELA